LELFVPWPVKEEEEAEEEAEILKLILYYSHQLTALF
jgi:hypothetical protein